MFHPYSFYLQKHKNAKIKRESALPFFSFPLLLHLVIHTPNVPYCLLLCPISPFGVSHLTIWDVPFDHLGYPILPFGVFARLMGTSQICVCQQATAINTDNKVYKLMICLPTKLATVYEWDGTRWNDVK